MNSVSIMGRITHDLELKNTTSGQPVLAFSIAVPRRYDKNKAQQEADFISCVAWNQQAVFITNHFAKGRMIALEGNLHSRSYKDKNGVTHYVTEVYISSVSFTGEPKLQKNSSINKREDSALPIEEYDYAVIGDDGVPF